MSESLSDNTTPQVPIPDVDNLPPVKKRNTFRRILRFVGRFIAAFVLIFVLLAAVIQTTPVQNWIIDKTTAYLSKELQTTVKIDHFALDFFNEISFNNFYVSNKNLPKDTLMNIGRLRLTVSYPYLLFGIVQLNAIKLENTTVRLKRDIGQYDFNHQFILDYFDPPRQGPSTPSKPADIRIGQIHLRDVDFISDDKINGKRLETRVKAADIHTNIMNLPKKLLDITSVGIYEPYFKLESFVKNPLPPKPSTTANTQVPPQSKQANSVVKEVEKPIEDKPFQFLIGAISIEGGTFVVDNWRKAPQKLLPDNLLDYEHMQVFDINAHFHNFYMFKNEVTGVVDGISCRDKSGFVLNKLTVGDAKITPTETALYGLQIETPNTLLGDTLRFIYPEGFSESFDDFENKVVLDARIHSGKVLIDDIMTFAVKLEKNPFFVKNRNESATLDVRAFGKINSLKLPSFNIQLGKGLQAEGKFESRDLTNSSETFIKLDLKSLSTTIASLRQLIPDFKPSEEFDRFGNLNFNGTFVGFFNDFIAQGRLNTQIGSAVMDMKLEPANENKNIPTYNGNLALDNFNLGAFTNNTDLGKISLKTSIIKGRGFRKDNVNLNLTAIVDNFQFKNYEYKNINLTGDLNQKLFNGILESKDLNANFRFDGNVDFAAATPVFKFKSNINKIDLKTLNLSKEDIGLAGSLNLDISGDKLSEITGMVDAKNIVITKDKTKEHKIDSLTIFSTKDADGSKHFDINSEILTAHIDGNFNIEKIPAAFINHFSKNHPRLAFDLGMPLYNPLSTPQSFKYKINILNSKSLTQLFEPKLDTLRNIALEGSVNDYENTLDWSLETTETHHFGDIKIVELGSIGRAVGTDIDWDLKTYNVVIGGKQDFKDITFQNHITGDTVEFGLTSHNFSQSLRMDTVELNALLMRQDSFYKLSFGTNQLSRLKIFGDYWDVAKDNFILWGKNNTLKIEGFDLRNRDRHIVFESCNTRGLSATLNNFDIAFLNSFVNDDRFTFGGKYLINVEFDDVFNQKDFRIHASMDTFIVKGENRGSLRIAAMGADFKNPIYADVLLIKDNERLNVNGYYYPTASDKYEANSIFTKINLQEYPFKTLQLLIGEGASRFAGRIDGGLQISGPLKKLDYNGALRIRDIGVTIDYIQSRLYVKDETVRISNNMFDATGGSVYDSLGHRARVTGGLTHNRFLDFGLNVTVAADTFLMLNTKKEDNSLYYGTGIGAGKISFTGDFNRTDIKIIAKTGKGTKITFPFSREQTAKETSFIVFKSLKNTEGVDTTRKVKELRGVNLDMELSLTEQAEVTLIFDENAGDNIKSKGTGDIHLAVNRSGDMTMDGEYRIAKGDYLFTLLGVVNKNFTLKPGGTIRWNGDPLNANINIDAEYKGLNTSPYNFISEYVTSDNAESRKPTPIELTLNLSGVLQKPDINFGLGFPRLQSELKGYAENKVRLLKQDQNELNRQVFGLIVFNTFLPSDVGFANNSQLRSGSINTVAETVSSYLSNIFNKFLGEYITGLDVEIGYNVYEYDRVSSTDPNKQFGQQFRLRGNYIIDDKWSVGGGVGVESGSVVQNLNNTTNFLGYDVFLDYSLSQDRRLKLRFSFVSDQVVQNRRYKPAVGLRFRKEFDKIEDLFKKVSPNTLPANTPANKPTPNL
jgi:TamB, inner membrane protein subunit of TAM complex